VGSKNAKITGSKIIKLTQTPKLRVAKIKGFTVAGDSQRHDRMALPLKWHYAVPNAVSAGNYSTHHFKYKKLSYRRETAMTPDDLVQTA